MILSRLGEIMRDKAVSNGELIRRTGVCSRFIVGLRANRTQRLDLHATELVLTALGVSFKELFYEVPGERKPVVTRRRRRNLPTPGLPPCGHLTRRTTCYDCLYNHPKHQQATGSDSAPRYRFSGDRLDADGD